MKNTEQIIELLRNLIQEWQEKYSVKEQGKNPSQFLLGKISAAHQILLSIGAVPEIDNALLIECETLIPKGAFWAGHELNRTLSFYKDYAKQKDWTKFIQTERLLRQTLMKARWEIYKTFSKIN